MTPKKDFSKINAKSVYKEIEEATQLEGQYEFVDEELNIAEMEQPEEAGRSTKRKPRKTYTKKEASEYMEQMNTAGRKGIKLKRINLAFSPSNYEFIQTMSQVRGQNMTAYINAVFDKVREEQQDIYKQALAFREKI